jgi:L-malate glycosyltransferase
MKIRVLHCMETIESGGVEQRKLSLARSLPKEIFEQQIICTKAKGPLYEEIVGNGITIHTIGTFSGFFEVAKYRKALQITKGWNPHIIHGAVFEGVAISSIVGTLAKTPIIINEEISDPKDRSWKGHLLFKLLLSRSNAIIGVSPFVRKYLIEDLGVNKNKIRSINNGVFKSAPAQQENIDLIRSKYNILHSDFVIGSVGRLNNYVKRYSDLIEAIHLVKDQIPNLKLLIVGDGPDRGMLEELSIKLGISEKVIFAGYQYNTKPFYSVMNVFALVSQLESFGLVLVEAMFATKVGGIQDVVVDGETGLLVEPFKPIAIAEKIVSLFNNVNLRSQMGNLGFIRAESEFSSERYVREINNLYIELYKSL